MILTDRFVYLHHPKTGGTFVTEMLKRVAKAEPSLNAKFLDGQEKHRGYRSIPEEYRGKPAVTNIRNIFEHYVSRYKFQHWAVPRLAKSRFEVDEVKKRFPNFPKLSFPEFMTLINDPSLRKKRGSKQKAWPRMGHSSSTLIKLTQTGPRKFAETFGEMSDEELRERFSHIHFLSTETLNADLTAYLVSVGIAEDKLNFIADAGVIVPKRGGRARSDTWHDYFTDELVEEVKELDRLYFRLFPEMVPNATLNA